MANKEQSKGEWRYNINQLAGLLQIDWYSVDC